MRPSNKRNRVRFGVVWRVDYRVGNRKTFAFTRDVSTAGMLVRGGNDLEVGAEVDFTLHIGLSDLLSLRGKVVRSEGRDIAVSFIASEADIDQIRVSIDEQLVNRLTDRLKLGSGVERAVDLASYYLENGRSDDALELFHVALGHSRGDIRLYESMAELLGRRISAVDDVRAETLLAELDTIVEEGLKVAPSETLASVKIDAAALRIELERRRHVLLTADLATMKARLQEQTEEAAASRAREDNLQLELDRLASELIAERERRQRAEEQRDQTVDQVLQTADLVARERQLKDTEAAFTKMKASFEKEKKRLVLERAELEVLHFVEPTSAEGKNKD